MSLPEEEPRDVFDRIMLLPVLRVFNPFYRKYKEKLLYLFFGGLTTVVDIVVFWLFCSVLGVNELIANVIAWIAAVLFAFVVNRTWVFDAKTEDRRETARQFFTFVGGRVFSLLCEEAILAVFITWLGLWPLPVKIAAQILVLILNYGISKWLVFRDPERKKEKKKAIDKSGEL